MGFNMAMARVPLSPAMRSGGGIHALAAENPATEMFSAADDPEPQFDGVDNYQFDDDDGPTCFSILPLKFDESDEVAYLDSKVDLHGSADSGLYKVHKKVVAWRVQFDYEKPIISVLSSEGNWIELLKPRKRYENTVRSILIAVQMLHYVRKWPRKRNKSLFDHLCDVFNKFDNKPAEYDLKKHKSIIKQFAEMDPTLMKSKILQRFIESTSWKIKKPILKVTGRKKTAVSSCRDDEEGFANNDDNDYNNRNNNSGDDNDYNDGNSKEDGNSDGKDDNSYGDYTSNNNDKSDDDINTNDDVGTDQLCAICDNGGKLLSCVGRCKRAFHPRKKDGRESNCETLGFSSAKLQEIDKYLCKNCEHKEHQCFKCGKLESSSGPNAKVFQCYKATCGHFYHPSCVAKLLEPCDTDGACELEKRLAAGMSFTCPAHWCSKCETMEDNTQLALWFAACRRCPIAYHKKCLPSKISFTKKPGAPIRAWRLGGKIIIYCEHHKMVDSIGTPHRDHIKLPFTTEIDRTRDCPKKKSNITAKRKKNADQGLAGAAELSNKLYREGDQIQRQRVAISSLTEHIVLKERGVPKKDTMHSNQVPIDELDNLILEKQDEGDENNYKTGKEIETHRENVCGHDLISGQKEISIRENLMGASRYDHDSSLGQEKIPCNKSNKVGSSYGEFTPDQVDYLPPEKQVQAACLDKETATNIIETQQECGRDFDQEVKESYACQHELKSPRCNDNSKAIEICTSDKQSRKREEPKEYATDCKMLDSGRKRKSIHMKKGRDACCEEESPWRLDNQKEPDAQSRKQGEPKKLAANSNMPDMDRSRKNIHMEKGRDAFCEDGSHQRLDNHKEPDVPAYNFINTDLNLPPLSPTQNSSRYNDDQRAKKTSEYKSKEGRGVNTREEWGDYERVNSFRGNSHMGRTNPQKRPRDHSPGGRRMNYNSSYPGRDNHHRYGQRRVADYSSDGDRRRWRCPDDYSSDYAVGRGLSPQQLACSPKFGTLHIPPSYPRRAEHRTSIKRGSSSYLGRSEHVTSGRHGPYLYPPGLTHEDYTMDQRAALVPRDPPNDEYTNVEHGHFDVMYIPPIDSHSSRTNYTGAYGPQTDTSMDQPVAVHGGQSYGVRSDYRQRNRLHLGDRASASGSVTEKYVPHLERTNQPTGGQGSLPARWHQKSLDKPSR